MATQPKETGADELRRIVRVLDNTREDALDPYTAEELIKLVRAQIASDWDITIDEWTPRQRREALKGRPPRWEAGDGGRLEALYCDVAVKVAP